MTRQSTHALFLPKGSWWDLEPFEECNIAKNERILNTGYPPISTHPQMSVLFKHDFYE